jgi:hypothetical protein
MKSPSGLFFTGADYERLLVISATYRKERDELMTALREVQKIARGQTDVPQRNVWAAIQPIIDAALVKVQPHCADHWQFEYDCLECSDALVAARGW